MPVPSKFTYPSTSVAHLTSVSKFLVFSQKQNALFVSECRERQLNANERYSARGDQIQALFLPVNDLDLGKY